MKIFIDGEPFSPSSPDESKKDILAEIDEAVAKKGLTYTDISVDGVDMDSTAFARLRGGREAHFKTCEIKALVVESLEEAIGYLPRFMNGIQSIASELERQEHGNINENLSNFVEGFDWLANVAQKCQYLLRIADSELPGKTEAIEMLNKSLGGITDSFENGRMTEIAFHMRQIIPQIDKFSDYINKLLSAAKSRN